MKVAKLLQADGTAEDVAPKNGKYFTLAELQAMVGGRIEILYLQDNMLLIINEEGKMGHMQKNMQASALWFALHPESGSGGDFVVGPVLHCSNKLVK